MEPNKQGDAADLEAHLHAIAKEVAPTATPDMLESQQPEAPSYGGVEVSPGDRIRSRTRDWLHSLDGPSFNAAPDAPNPSVAPKRSGLSVDAEEYHPISLSLPSAVQSSSTPSFSASQGQTSARGTRSLTLEEDRALRRFLQLLPGDVGSAGSSARLVRSLKEGCEVVRKGVLDGVKGALQFVMGSPEWRDVFVELLREGSFDELRVIVDVACKADIPLTSVADSECGVESLMDLFRAVKPHSQLRRQLISCLLNNRLVEAGQVKAGPDLLRGIFATFPYEDTWVFIQHALDDFNIVLSSKFGSKSMVECFAAAKNAELENFQGLILTHIVPFAKGRFSNYFLQGVLKLGDDALKESITDRILQHLMSVSMDPYGSYVVQACFTLTGSVRLTLLQRVLTAFGGLSYGELAQLVQDPFATYVVSELLLTGKAVTHFLDETMALAQTIERLPVPAGLHPDKAVAVRNVMQAVREVLS